MSSSFSLSDIIADLKPATLVLNRRAIFSPEPGPDYLGKDASEAYRELLQSCPRYQPTPLFSLDKAASAIGIERIYFKEEAGRFGLGSFKVLGGTYAVGRLLQEKIGDLTGDKPSLEDMVIGRFRDQSQAITVTTATDGNHGRSVAAGARLFGCQAIIYVPGDVTGKRVQSIALFGAKVVKVKGTYDDAVARCVAESRANHWHMVSDTAYEGYEAIPQTIMGGYTAMIAEIAEQLASDGGLGDITHLFLQGGCGGLAASLIGHLQDILGIKRPIMVIVEPLNAAAISASILAGSMVHFEGDLHTIMGGLSVGDVSTIAWDVIEKWGDAFITIADDGVPPLMQALAEGHLGADCVEAGETGVAGLLGLLSVASNPEFRVKLKLDERSHVLLIGTEGATDPEAYMRFTGHQPKVFST